MAGIKYDVSDVPETGGGEQAPPNMYKGKIRTVKERHANAQGDPVHDLEVVVDVGDEYMPLWTYISLDSAAARWKLREFTDAIGLPPKGTIDPKKCEGKPVSVKVVADTDLSGNYRGRVKNLFKPGKVPDTEEEPDDGEPSEDGEVLDREELETWDIADLKAEVEERGLEVSGRKTASRLIDAILKDVGANGDEPEEPEEEPTGEFDISTVEGYEDFETWETEDLKADLEERGLKVAGRYTDDKAREAIIEAVAEEQGEGGGEPGEPDDDYDQWPDQDLKDEIQTRIEQGAEIEIPGRKTKAKLIAALREDDKAAAEPF